MRKFIFYVSMPIFVCTIFISAQKLDSNILNFKRTEAEYQTTASAISISLNSLGDIAIGFRDKHINVYDKDGEFKYSYNFDFNGSFVFEFDSLDSIIIYPVRGNTRYFFDTDAKLLKTEVFTNQVESGKYYRKLINNKNISMNGINYNLYQSFWGIKLVKRDVNGNETLIYRGRDNYISKGLIILSILSLIIVAIVIIVRSTKRF